MSIYDKASLVLIPSGTKTSKVYSQKPVSGDGDFTFSRSTAATRVNADGNIEKETQNLLLQSNSFSNASWQKTNSSVTGGQSGYDSSSNAWLLEKTSNAARVEQSISFSGVNTFSIYAKSNASTWLRLYFDGVSTSVYYNLSDGSIGGSYGSVLVDASTEDIGGGWYRCSAVMSGSGTNCRVYPADSNGDVSGTSGSIYIQDAQLEQGLVARDYIETTTAAIYGGITDNVPRLDYTDSSCPALLLEPQRKNDWKFSEYASGNHLVGSPTITQNYAESPEGVNNAFRIQDTTGTSFKRIAESSGGLSVSVNSTYTQSLFVKKATSAVSSNGGVGFDYSGGTRQISYIIFDEYNGTMTALQSQSTLTLHDVEDYGDYWRFSISAKDTGNNTNLSLNIYACLSGNGTTISLGTKDWTGYGLQLEEGSYATSYIPTYGSAVTRNSEATGVVDVSSLGVTTGYTLFYELGDFNVSALSTWVRQNTSNGSAIEAYGSTLIVWRDGGVAYPFGHGDGGVGSNTKKAITYDGVNIKAYSDGVLRGTYTADKNRWDNLTNFDMNNGSLQMVNWEQVIILPTALTDQEAIDLTTI